MKDTRELKIVSKYLNNKGFQPTRITDEGMPDFMVHYPTGSFFCEVKNPQLVLDEKTQMFTWQATFSKIYKFINKASQQFQIANTTHDSPNILIWTSFNFQLNYHSFLECIQGYVGIEDSITRDFRNAASYQKSVKNMAIIDVYIWLQCNDSDNIYQENIFINKNGRIDKDLVEMFATRIR